MKVISDLTLSFVTRRPIPTSGNPVSFPTKFKFVTPFSKIACIKDGGSNPPNPQTLMSYHHGTKKLLPQFL